MRNLGTDVFFLTPQRFADDGIWEQWFSICSAHQSHDSECELCATGNWTEIKLAAEEVVEEF